MHEILYSPLFIFFFNSKGHLMRNGRRCYGFGSFLFDVFMTVITAGFWLIWIFVREMRNR